MTGRTWATDRYGREVETKRHTLVVEVPAALIDEGWTDQDLVENAAWWLDALIRDGNRRLEDPPYRLKPDVTVWASRDDYHADIAEGYA